MLDAISILIALLIGFLLVRAADPVRDMQPAWAATLFRMALGAGIGIGLTSIVFLILDVSGFATPVAIFGADSAILAVLVWQYFRTRAIHRPRSLPDETPPGFRWTWLLALIFAAALSILGVRVIQTAAALPVGDWDAWALWNLRAKFLAGPAGAWHYALSPLISNTHPDYPLLLSAFIARAWKAGGAVDAIAPIVTAMLFFAALLALLVSVVALLRSTASALLAGLVMLSTTSLLAWAPSQYADIPLAFYYLGAIALIFLAAAQPAGGLDQQPARHAPLFWAGLCTGFAAWTKNEGIAFLATVLLVFVSFTFWKRRTEVISRTAWLLAGVMPGILLTLWLKFFLAPAVDPLVRQGASGFSRLVDASRYFEVAKGFFNNLLNLGSGISHPLILLAILSILVGWQVHERYRLASFIATTSLLLVFLSYCAVYIVTPYALAWQVQSSFDRLLLQLWPSAVLVFFIQLRRVIDTASPAPPIKNAATRKAPSRSGKAVSAGKAK